MYRVRRFGVIKTATVVAVMYMLIVAVFVVPFLLLALVFGSATGYGGTGGTGGFAGILIFGLLAIFGYGALGWVFTAIGAAIYNLAARWVGGIEVQIETVAPPPPLPVWNTVPPNPIGQPRTDRGGEPPTV
ncbi:MAG TPA: hypothetical protein VM408_02460 [Methylomirabilota bacterium]|nr:hypothetical protein [Methylomirabilota bacterium]